MPDASAWLERIRALRLPRPIRVLNVCGGHKRSISMAGIRGVLPPNVTLIPGTGCPVCVCPEADILDAFGDMLRVPANVARSQTRSLAEARTQGADLRATHPDRALHGLR